MRVVDTGLQAHLDTGATTLARAWIVTRRDGVVMGFTDHDQDLTVDGVLCRAASGMDAVALETTTGLSVDNSQAIGALSSDVIREIDIETGVYDGAKVALWLVNWADQSQTLQQFAGHLGEITRGNGLFEAELRGLSEALNQPTGRAYMRQCDAVLGDARCGVDLTAPGMFAEDAVDFISGRRVIELKNITGFAEGFFLHGSVEWLSGANAGRTGLIRVDGTRGPVRIIELLEETRFDIAQGDLIRLQAGCDKSAATCTAKFANFANFRGFPHLPGEDWATSYPKQGEPLDGSSRYK